MTHSQPFEWIKRISEDIVEAGEIPLFGKAPPFDWRRVSAMLAERFGIQKFELKPASQEWRHPDEAGIGLGKELLIVPITLSPLAPPLYWMMARSDREKFTAWMLNGQAKGKAFSSDILQEGYYRFLLLEALDAAQGLAPIQKMTLHLGDEAEVPEENVFCIDVEMKFDGKACWGRLLATASFRRAWIHHFSSFPSEYIPNDLAKKLELPLGIKTGSVLLTQQEWKKLKEGDFLLLDKGSYDAKKQLGLAVLMMGRTPLFQLKIKQNKIELVDYAFIHEDTMQEQKSAPAPSMEKLEPAEGEPSAIKDVPLHLTVEIARVKMTLEKLMSLTPGNMLELPVDPDQGVSLTVNGQKVGKGELLYLGDTLGVRILEIG